MIGREPELATLEEFLASDARPRTAVISGEPGIGKTTLWEEAVARARALGIRVLTARGSPSETGFAFVGLADLLDDVDREELSAIPAPQRNALEVALLRAEPDGPSPDVRAVSVGLYGALRAISSNERIAVAIDDVTWLDAASSGPLCFAARRLGDEIRFVLARRTESSSELEAALEPGGLLRLELQPLSFGALRRLIFERLGLRLTRPEQRTIFDAARGNPLYALELARTAQSGSLDELNLPAGLDQLLAARVEALPGAARKVLVASELSGGLRASQALGIAGDAALEQAVDLVAVRIDGDRIRPSHPLLGAAARSMSKPEDRRELHRALAETSEDDAQRARHLALATPDSDPDLAGAVATAAASASRRGANRDAAELAGHAVRLTPSEAPERPDRLLEQADYLLAAGELERVTDLLAGEIESLPAGAKRVKALVLLADSAAVSTTSEFADHLERAVLEARGEPQLAAPVLWRKAEYAALGRVEAIVQAESWAQEAVSSADPTDPDTARLALVALGWTRILRGRAIDDLESRFRAHPDATVNLYRSFDRLAAIRVGWRGEVEPARGLMERLIAAADEQGDEWSYSVLRLNLCEIELRMARWEAVDRLLAAWEESQEAELLMATPGARCRALAAAGRGEPEEARRAADRALADASSSGMRWEGLEALRARAIASLLEHDAPGAADALRTVWAHACREGVDDPGVFPVAPDLVEALVENEKLDEARDVTGRLRELAEEQDHPWGLASVKRCEGLLRFGDDSDLATASLLEAVGDYDSLGLRFDAARTLLLLGGMQRRHKKWAAARESLDRAATAFDGLGSTGWSEAARSELGRIGARKPRPPGELTPTEQRVAALAADGKSNKEIAQALFVTVHTVEAHLSHAYAKLGIRSRSQLSGRLEAGG